MIDLYVRYSTLRMQHFWDDVSRPESNLSRPHAERDGTRPRPASPILDFLRALGARRSETLHPLLHEEVVYQVEGFEPINGLRAVLAYWRRMFDVHEAIRIIPARHVRDGDVVIVAQRQLYLAARRAPLVIDSLAVYELEDERIRLWSEWPDGQIPQEDAALWRRLRTARW